MMERSSCSRRGRQCSVDAGDVASEIVKELASPYGTSYAPLKNCRPRSSSVAFGTHKLGQISLTLRLQSELELRTMTEPETFSVSEILAADFDELYNHVRYTDSIVDALLRAFAEDNKYGLFINATHGRILAGTDEAWNPASRDLRDKSKSLDFSATVEYGGKTDIFRQKCYDFSGTINSRTVLGIAVVAKLMVNAIPSIDKGDAEFADFILRTNGTVEILHRAYDVAKASCDVPSYLPDEISFSLANVNLFRGLTFVEMFSDGIEDFSISGCEGEHEVVTVPWELLTVLAFKAGFWEEADLRIVKAMAYVEMIMQKGIHVTPALVEHHEAFDVLVAEADQILARASPSMMKRPFKVLHLCKVLEEEVVDDDLDIVDLLFLCNLGSKSLERIGGQLSSYSTNRGAMSEVFIDEVFRSQQDESEDASEEDGNSVQEADGATDVQEGDLQDSDDQLTDEDEEKVTYKNPMSSAEVNTDGALNGLDCCTSGDQMTSDEEESCTGTVRGSEQEHLTSCSKVPVPDETAEPVTVSLKEAQIAFNEYKETGDLLYGAKASVFFVNRRCPVHSAGV